MLNVEVKHYRPIVGQVSCVGIGHNTFPLNFGNYFWISNGPYIVAVSMSGKTIKINKQTYNVPVVFHSKGYRGQ